MSLLAAINWSTRGWGATKKVFPNPHNEEERKANRRVVITATIGEHITPVKFDWRQGARRSLDILANKPPSGQVRR